MVNPLRDIARDLNYGLRHLRRSPGFALTAIALLATGIGVNTTLFALRDALLFGNPPGVSDPATLVQVIQRADAHSASGRNAPGMSWDDVNAYRSRGDVFADVGGVVRFNYSEVTAEIGDQATSARAIITTDNYFALLRVPMTLGAGWRTVADRAPENGLSVVISHDYWKRAFGAATDVVGRSIKLDGLQFTVLGVLATGFRGAPSDVSRLGGDVWLTRAGADRLTAQVPELKRFTDMTFESVVARLRTGARIEQATAAIAGLAAQRGEATSPASKLVGFARPVSGRESLDQWEIDGRSPVMIGYGIVTMLILIIASLNVGTLLLVRASSRQREMAVRLSLGASRARVVRQLITESSLLAVGAAVAVYAILQVAAGFARQYETLAGFAVTPKSLLFATAVGLGTVILFGLTPALHATRATISTSLKNAAAPGTGSANRLKGGTVVGLIVLTQPFLVIVGATLTYAMNFASLQQSEFASRVGRFSIVRARPSPVSKGVDDAHMVAAIAAVPGVVAVSSLRGGSSAEISSAEGGATLRVDGRNHGNVAMVAPGFPEMIRARIHSGRTIQQSDVLDRRRVAVINEETAHALFGRLDVLGQQVNVTDYGDTKTLYEIVGTFTIGNDWAQFAMFTSDTGTKAIPAQRSFYMEASGPMDRVFPEVRRAVQAADPSSLVRGDIRTLAADREKQNRLMQIFLYSGVGGGIVAVLLATVGLYAVIAFGVLERTREIGVRLALGATSPQVVWMFVKRGMRLTVIGVVVGLPPSVAGIIALQRALNGFVIGPVATISIAVVMAIGAGLFASWLPARRASLVDPVAALRSE